ncbi:MAG TPA: iron-sulfur cluster insertion protein ErpA [Candidatus Saccharimonadales bacterium]
MIIFTDKAIAQIKKISDDGGIGHYNIRVLVKGGGCSGFNYDMVFEEIINELDETEDVQGIKIVVDPMSYQYLDGVTVDFEDGLMGGGFRFKNPNATGGCGCGKSFSA